MPRHDDDLPFGLYERLITASLKARLLRFSPEEARVKKRAFAGVDLPLVGACALQVLLTHLLPHRLAKTRVE